MRVPNYILLNSEEFKRIDEVKRLFLMNNLSYCIETKDNENLQILKNSLKDSELRIGDNIINLKDDYKCDLYK